jgi:hypothetical protein
VPDGLPLGEQGPGRPPGQHRGKLEQAERERNQVQELLEQYRRRLRDAEASISAS